MTRATRACVILGVVTSFAMPRASFACDDDDDCKHGRVCTEAQCVWPKAMERWADHGHVPAGYHEEHVHSTGLIVAGTLTLAIGLVFFASANSSDNHDDGHVMTVFGSVISLTGIGLLIGGIPTHPILVRDEVRSASSGRTWGASIGFGF